METKSWNRGRLIGSGSFGTVSLASDKATGRVFAVKSVSPTSSPPLAILSLENEIEILKGVSSPHIVSYLGDDTTREANLCRNLHMEYVPGGTVAELAAKRGGLEENEIRGYARCLTRALHYLHFVAGVIHGDVKGRNLLVGSGLDGTKLSDFGSAKHLDDIGNQANWIGGTPYWMAPEAARGEIPSPASDVWSLGCTIIEMATGIHPWAELGVANTDVAGLLLRIGYDGKLPKYPTNLSKDGRDFLDKCLKSNPTERWGCENLLLHPFLSETSQADPTGPSPRGVLDWEDSEFGDESELHSFDSFESEFEFGDDDGEVYGLAMERLRSLCSSESESEPEKESLDWGCSDDGWETVRWVQEEQERTGSEGSDFDRASEEQEIGQTSGDGIRQLEEASGDWVRQQRTYPHFGCSNCDCGRCFCCDCKCNCKCKDGFFCYCYCLVVGPIGSCWKPLLIFYLCYCVVIVMNFLSMVIVIKLCLQFSCCCCSLFSVPAMIFFLSGRFCLKLCVCSPQSTLHTRIDTLRIILCIVCGTNPCSFLANCCSLVVATVDALLSKQES